MIGSFRSKALTELFRTGKSRRVRPDLAARALQVLDVLHSARSLRELDLPGLRYHPLKGRPKRHALAVNGPWRITFEWEGEDALRVNLEQYH